MLQVSPCQNLDGIVYLHWRTDWEFERFDIFLCEIGTYKYYWTLEPGKKTSHVLKHDSTSLSVLDASTSEFEATHALEYLEHLKTLEAGPIHLTDENFDRFKKLVKTAPFQFTEIIKSVLNKGE